MTVFGRCLFGSIAAGVLSASLGCGGGGSGDPRACSEGCAATARCLGGSCVEDLAPEAVLHVPAGVRALELAELDGSSSSDPDASLGDHVAEHRWTLTSLGQGCAAPTVAGTGPKAQVRFACAGAFRVQLLVVDDLGKESAPATADVAVDVPGPSPVVASSDQAVNHVCAGSPLACTTEGTPPAVSAHLASGTTSVGTVTYRWWADPPGGAPLDEHRRIGFSPSADVANPSVHLDVDSTAVDSIVNDWVLHVSARDGAGPLGEATTRISVTNRPPALVSAAAAVSVDHGFSSGAYRATARTSRWRDPDGDPLRLATGTGDAICAAASFDPDGTAVVECSKAFDAAPGLHGFAGTHAVSIQPRDPWQAASPSATTITVLNRPVSATSSTVKGYLACDEGTTCCFMEGNVCSAWELDCAEQSKHPHPSVSDPDGDPLEVTWAGGGFVAQSIVCEPAACTATTTPIAAYRGCHQPSGTRVGDFTASDGLTSATATLTYEY